MLPQVMLLLRRQRTPPTLRQTAWYPRLLTTRPWLVISVIFVMSTACLLFCLLTYGPPNFELTATEFLTVNTPYSAKMIQFNSLINGGSTLPHHLRDRGIGEANNSSSSASDSSELRRSIRSLLTAKWKSQNISGTQRLGPLDAEDRSLMNNLAVVYELQASYSADQLARNQSGSALEFVPMRQICEFEEQLAVSETFKTACHKEPDYNRCLPSLSLPNLVASRYNLTTCRELQPHHVTAFAALLESCMPHAGNVSGFSRDAPARCRIWQLSAALRLAIPMAATQPVSHVQTVFQFPNDQSSVYAELIRLERQGPNGGILRISGVLLSPQAELRLFGQIILGSLSWLALAILGIALITWLYTESALLVAATMAVILCSLALAYAVCAAMSGSNSFSMLNSMAVVLAVGIGSDDVFVIAAAWRHAKKDHRDCRLEKLMSDTIQHAGLSVTVTSLTTIAAFATNVISPIVAINSFAIYASLTVCFNLFLMLTVVPAVIVVAEQSCRTSTVCDRLHRRQAGFAALVTAGCARFLSLVAVRLRYLVHLCSAAVLVFCFLSVAYYPGLRFPKSNRRSLFTPDNPVEGYHTRFNKAFRLQAAIRPPTIRVHLVWGVDPKDGRHFLSPASELPVNYNIHSTDPEFFESNSTRLWFERFCTMTIKKAPYIASFISHDSLFCSFNGHETAAIIHGFQLTSRQPYCRLGSACCKTDGSGENNNVMSSPNYARFNACLTDYLEEVKNQLEEMKPFYFDNTGRLAAFRASYATDVPVGAANFTSLSRMVAELDAWFAALSEVGGGSVAGVRPGFIYAEGLQEWELRRALKAAVLQSAGAALAAAAVTFFLTTLNPLLALQSLLVLTVTLCGTACVLLWAGWCVDIVECVILTSSFGLAVDFTLHYGVAFRMHSEEQRITRASLVLRKTAPPITFAAITTCLAGAVVVTSSVYVARMTGVFLITVSGMAWLGACLVFPSVIVTIGNERAELCQAGCPDNLAEVCQCLCTGSDARQRRDLTPYASEVRDATDMAELSGTESSSDRLLSNNGVPAVIHANNNNSHGNKNNSGKANNAGTKNLNLNGEGSGDGGGVSSGPEVQDSPVWKRRTEVG